MNVREIPLPEGHVGSDFIVLGTYAVGLGGFEVPCTDDNCAGDPESHRLDALVLSFHAVPTGDDFASVPAVLTIRVPFYNLLQMTPGLLAGLGGMLTQMRDNDWRVPRPDGDVAMHRLQILVEEFDPSELEENEGD